VQIGTRKYTYPSPDQFFEFSRVGAPGSDAGNAEVDHQLVAPPKGKKCRALLAEVRDRRMQRLAAPREALGIAPQVFVD
jgi:hypothetical protein